MKSLLFTLTVFLAAISVAAQSTQIIKGSVIDRQSEMPLMGASVVLAGSDPVKGTITDLDGQFVLEGIPAGRHTLQIQYLGYESMSMPNILVTAGKETVLTISLQESLVDLSEVVVVGKVDKDRPQNELATVSARQFNLEEVTRYSGGRNDVSRLVSNFAGVSTADDSRNDIVIRGNSPTGVLWRMEGIPIPNPNHFTTLGTTGGPVSALNPNLLNSSDFLTGAFPAEYGNALAGVFDLQMRTGNKDRMEYTIQLGAISGLEAMVEGPLNRSKGGSFVAGYRYSFVDLARQAGLPIGTNASPQYQDLTFKIDFGQSKLGRFYLFGIGGKSSIDFLAEEVDENDLWSDPTQDLKPRSQLGVLGLRHQLVLGEQTYLRSVVAYAGAGTQVTIDGVVEDDGRRRIFETDDLEQTISISSFINHKFSARHTLRTGVVGQIRQLDTYQRDRNFRPDWVVTRDFDGQVGTWQAYAQSQYRLGQKLTLNTGLNALLLDLNNSFALEPRVGMNWNFRPKQTLSIAYGLHNQMQPLPVLLFQQLTSTGYVAGNENLGFTASHQWVLGYDVKPAQNWRIKTEAYYQLLRNAPVERTLSSFSILNVGADFAFPERGDLVNEGKGYNYGAELTIEKFFSKGYYGLLTASLYQSKYQGSDEIWRHTAFDNTYILNTLAGREFRFGKEKRNAITLDTKLTTAGGRRYTPVNLEASQQTRREILDDANAFSERFSPYFRWDAKVGYRINSAKRKLSQTFFLDFQNLTNHDNVFARRYNAVTNQVNLQYQSGFFVDVLYRVQF